MELLLIIGSRFARPFFARASATNRAGLYQIGLASGLQDALRRRFKAVPTDKNTLDEVQAFMNLVPFNLFLALHVDELDQGYAKLSTKFREEFIGDPMRRALHGGLLSAIIDTCGGAAVWTKCERGDRLSTVDLRVDYLRPGLPEDVFVEGRVLRLGNRVGVAAMVAYHAGRKSEPVATGTAVYNVRRSPEGPGTTPPVLHQPHGEADDEAD